MFQLYYEICSYRSKLSHAAIYVTRLEVIYLTARVFDMLRYIEYADTRNLASYGKTLCNVYHIIMI